jgi:hypothetical protein
VNPSLRSFLPSASLAVLSYPVGGNRQWGQERLRPMGTARVRWTLTPR